ncbi:MAG: phospholipase [Chloroflexi bacterium]|nr:phospholipase [Chloroflexota bacterium]
MTHTPELPLRHEAIAPRIATDAQPPLIVLLHGYGSNEEDLLQLAPYLPDTCQLVSFRAPFMLRPGSNCWFEIAFTPEGIWRDLTQAEQSYVVLDESISAAITAYNTDPTRTFVVGFSQGGGMAGICGLRRTDIMGTAILSGINPWDLASFDTQPAGDFLVVHGTYDEVVKVSIGHETRHRLTTVHANVHYAELPIGHTIDLRVIAELTRFIGARL